MSVAPTPDDNETGKDVLVIDFAGEIYRVEPTQSFTVGAQPGFAPGGHRGRHGWGLARLGYPRGARAYGVWADGGSF